MLLLNGFNNYINYNIDYSSMKKKSINEKLFHLCRCRGSRGSDVEEWSNSCNKIISTYVHNVDYKEYTGKMKYWFDIYHYGGKHWYNGEMNSPYGEDDLYDRSDFKFYIDYMDVCFDDMKFMYNDFVKFVGKDDIYKYLEIREFKPCVYITISPDWSNYSVDIYKRRDLLILFNQELFKLYGMFSDYQYAIECGKQGSHIHSHAVFEVKHDSIKRFKGMATKGNLHRKIREVWDKMDPQLPLEGCEGALKSKFAIELMQIYNQEILKDKLDYLIEELKPEEHKNANVKGFPIYKCWD